MGKQIMSESFVHLHAHTSIGSMQDAMANVYKMFDRAKELGQPALAITDHGTLAAVFDARRASKTSGVKYIPGCEIYFVDDIGDKKSKRRHLILLAKNETGYKNLLQINYLGYKNFQYIGILGKTFPRVDWNILKEHAEGLICLTACSSGPISRALFERDEDECWDQETCSVNALGIASRLKQIFGEDLYLEIQPHSLKVYKHNRKSGELELDKNGEPIKVIDQEYLNKKLLHMSNELDIPLVATCDVHYLEKEDAKIHDMLMAINEKKPLSDKNRHRYEVEEFYMKSGGDVLGYFSDKFDRKFALKGCNNTVDIANKCDDPVYLDSDEIKFPKFDPKTEEDYEDFLSWKGKQKQIPESEDHAFLRYRSIKAFKSRFGNLPKEKREEYKERMIKEIKVLESRNFSSYILITADLIQKAREHGIRVGPGRGSVGGSLVAGLLGIHEVDPLEYGLLFERFINVYKAAFPDVDIDFSPDGRDWVEQYAIRKYGEKCVAHVSNLSTMTPKTVIKDIARSLELGGNKSEAFKIANAITDVIPDEANTFDDALMASEKFREFCAKYPELERYGRKLVGLEKTYSTHAAGVIISDRDLTEFVPLRFDKEGTVSVQYEKERCEQEGLIKMDFLGLEHLKIIDATRENVKQLGGTCPDTTELYPFNDKGVWNMISKGHTICVFQMGSHHMRNLCKRIRPQNIEDLSLVNALGRPSAIKSREEYIACRDNNTKVRHKHKCVKDALDDTLGVCVYEDQLMKFSNLVAGWDLNKADGLRKLTKYKKKDPALANRLKEEFIEGAMEHSGLKKEEAKEVWEEIIDPFNGYGFNKPHGIFYSLNGYHTAYYKYHYPAAFMAAVLKSEVEKSSTNEDKVKLYKKEANRMGIKIVAPDVNKSGEFFSVIDDKTIIMGLAAIKGVGIKAVLNIVETRNEHEFTSFADFLYRTNSSYVRKNVIEPMAKAGCFDGLGISRKAAFEQFSSIRTKANKHMEKAALEGKDAWDALAEEDFINKLDISSEEWNKKEILTNEAETLGDFVSGDINDLYGGFFKNDGIPLKRLSKLADSTPVKVEVIVDSINEPKIKSGKNKGKVYGNCVVVDRNKDSATMKIWTETWNKIKNKIVVGRPIRAQCRVNIYKGNCMLVLNALEQVG